MRPLPLILAVMLAGALGPDAVAQTAALKDVKQGSASPLRYRFSHVNDGVMRLDHQTGRLVFCKSLTPGKWQCDPVPEEEGVLLAQLKQAETDNTKLTEQLGELQKAFRNAGRGAGRSQGSDREVAGRQRRGKAASWARYARRSRHLNSSLPAIIHLEAELARMRSSNEALAAELAAMRRDIANVGTQVTAQKQGEVAARRDHEAAERKQAAQRSGRRPSGRDSGDAEAHRRA